MTNIRHKHKKSVTNINIVSYINKYHKLIQYFINSIYSQYECSLLYHELGIIFYKINNKSKLFHKIFDIFNNILVYFNIKNKFKSMYELNNAIKNIDPGINDIMQIYTDMLNKIHTIITSTKIVEIKELLNKKNIYQNFTIEYNRYLNQLIWYNMSPYSNIFKITNNTSVIKLIDTINKKFKISLHTKNLILNTQNNLYLITKMYINCLFHLLNLYDVYELYYYGDLQKIKSINSTTNKNIFVTKKYIKCLYKYTKKFISPDTSYNKTIFSKFNMINNKAYAYLEYSKYIKFIIKRFFNDKVNVLNSLIILNEPSIEYDTDLFDKILKCKQQYLYIDVLLRSTPYIPSHKNVLLIDKISKSIYHIEPLDIPSLCITNYMSYNILAYFLNICLFIKNYNKEHKTYILTKILLDILNNKIYELKNSFDIFNNIFSYKYNFNENRKHIIDIFPEYNISSTTIILSSKIKFNNIKNESVIYIANIKYNSVLGNIINNKQYYTCDTVFFIIEKSMNNIFYQIYNLLIIPINKEDPIYEVYTNLEYLLSLYLTDYTYYSPLVLNTISPLIKYEPNIDYDPSGYCIVESTYRYINFLLFNYNNKEIDIYNLIKKYMLEYNVDKTNLYKYNKSIYENTKYIRYLNKIFHQYVYKSIVYIFDKYNNIILYDISSYLINSRYDILIMLRSKLVYFKHGYSNSFYNIINDISDILLRARNIIYYKNNDTIIVKFNNIKSLDNRMDANFDSYKYNFLNDNFSKKNRFYDTDINWKWIGIKDNNNENIITYSIDLLKKINFNVHKLYIINSTDIINSSTLLADLIEEFIKEYFRILLINELPHNSLYNMLTEEFVILNYKKFTKTKYDSKLYKKMLDCISHL